MTQWINMTNTHGVSYICPAPDDFDPNTATNEEWEKVLDAGRTASQPKWIAGREMEFWPELPGTLRLAAQKLRVFTDDMDAWDDLDHAADLIEEILIKSIEKESE